MNTSRSTTNMIARVMDHGSVVQLQPVLHGVTFFSARFTKS